MKAISFLAIFLLSTEASATSTTITQDVVTFNTRGRRNLQRCREKDDDEFRTAARGNKRPCSWLKNDKDHIKDECGNRKSDADEVCPITCGACKDENDDDEDEDEPDDLGKDFDELEYLGGGFKGHGKCSGSCKKDDDCKQTLECFEREDDEDVPGCEGKGKDGVNYCFDPSDMEIAPKTFSPTRAPTSNKPTDMPTPSPTRKPTDMPALEERDDPTAFPTLPPVVQENMEKQVDEDSLVNSPLEEIMPEDIGVEVPSFFVVIDFLTPSRRRLGVLADNINTNKLESIIADVAGRKMLTIYPETFQDIDIEAELVSETKQKEITTVMYECSGQAIFLDTFSVEENRLPHAKDVQSIILEALGDDVLSEELRLSDDAVLSASQAASVTKSGAAFPSSKGDADSVSVGIVILVAVIVCCVLLIIGAAFVYIYRMKSSSKENQAMAVNKCDHENNTSGDELPSDNKGVSRQKLGADSSPTRTHNTDLEDSYDRDSNAGDYSVGYSESILESMVDGGSIDGCDGESIEDGPKDDRGQNIRAGTLRALDTDGQ